MEPSERNDFTKGRIFICIHDVPTARKGKGCAAGNLYLFEYNHNNGDSYYRKLNGNDFNDEVYISDNELQHNFKEVLLNGKG